MYALCYKEPCIVAQSHQTWRGKQLALCEDKDTLQAWIDKQPDKDKYYIEKQGY